MRIDDYLISFLLAALVIRQLRGKRLTPFGLAWPVAVVVLAGVQYLRPVPDGGDNPLLVMLGVSVGAGLGLGCGLLTAVRPAGDGTPIARASGTAAVLWVTGTLARVVFEVFAEHGGGPAIGRFNQAHHIATVAWTAALVLMALAEVLGRTAVLGVRLVRLRRVQPEM